MTDARQPFRRADDLPEVGMTVRDMVISHDVRIRSLEDWRLEMKTVLRLLVAILGTSVIGAVIGVLNLIDMASRQAR